MEIHRKHLRYDEEIILNRNSTSHLYRGNYKMLGPTAAAMEEKDIPKEVIIKDAYERYNNRLCILKNDLLFELGLTKNPKRHERFLQEFITNLNQFKSHLEDHLIDAD